MKKHGFYTPDEDAIIAAAFALPALSPERSHAIHDAATKMGVSQAGLRQRWKMLRGGIKKRRYAPAPPAQPAAPQIVAAPVARPSWMAPITRSRLMAGR